MAGRDTVLIGTPTADGIVTTGYAESLANAIAAILATGRGTAYRVVDFYDVAEARNHIVHEALARPEVSRVLFIDNDMRIEPAVFSRLLAAGKPVAGGVYVKRQTDLEAYAQARMAGHEPDAARALASPFVVRLAEGTHSIDQGFLPVDGVGMGCTLIDTGLLHRMAASGRLAQRRGIAGSGPVWDFFSRFEIEPGLALTDDFAFCARANQAEPGAVWAYVGGGLSHQGRFDHEAPFLARLKIHQAAQAARAE